MNTDTDSNMINLENMLGEARYERPHIVLCNSINMDTNPETESRLVVPRGHVLGAGGTGVTGSDC